MVKIIIPLFIVCVALTSCKKDNIDNFTPSQSDTTKPVTPPLPPSLPINLPTVSLDVVKMGPISSDYVEVRGTVSIVEHDTLRIDSIKISYESTNISGPFIMAGTVTKGQPFVPTKNYSFNTVLFVRDSKSYRFTIFLTFKNGSKKSFDSYFRA